MKKRIYIFLIAFIAFVQISRGQNFYVNVSSDDGTAPVVLAQQTNPSAKAPNGTLTRAVMDAVNYLNTNQGPVATVYLQVQSGNINMKGNVHIIDYSNTNGSTSLLSYIKQGKLIIKPSNISKPQTFSLNTSSCEYYDASFTSMFYVYGKSTTNPTIEFDDVTFKDFYRDPSGAWSGGPPLSGGNTPCNLPPYSSAPQRTCIYCIGGDGLNLNIFGCTFLNNYSDINYSGGGSISSGTFDVDGSQNYPNINPNTIFTKNSISNGYTTLTNPSSCIEVTQNCDAVIRNCIFNLNNIPNPVGYAVHVDGYSANTTIPNSSPPIITGKVYYAPSLTFSKNIMSDYSLAFLFIRVTDLSKATITYNTFYNNSYPGAFYVYSGFNSPVFDYNTFYNNHTDIAIGSGAFPTNPGDDRYDPFLELIKADQFGNVIGGYAPKNDHNVFNPINQQRSTISMDFGINQNSINSINNPSNNQNSKVIGYSNLSVINTENNNGSNAQNPFGAIIRANNILIGSGANVISIGSEPAAAILTANAISYSLPNPNTLIANFTASNIFSTSNNVAADFYVSNANGDLLAYIGSYPSVISGLNSNVSISIPPGINLSCSTRVAMTITSIDATGKLAAGTSEASYAYIPGPTCPTAATIIPPPTACVDEPSIFTNSFSPNSSTACYDFTNSFVWTFDDGGTSTDINPTHVFNSGGNHSVTLTLNGGTSQCPAITAPVISINVSDNCCPTCLPTFKLIPGKKYVVGAWASEENQQKSTFTLPQIYLKFTVGSNSVLLGPYKPKYQVVEGWQRIEEVFTVPAGATDVDVQLTSSGPNNHAAPENVYFDDIRVHPFDASFKSFVYDPVTLKFVAELDNNNYATFYEYDDEGKLVRVKKETENRIFTVKESRNGSPKK